ncbi:hypothetical protein KIN20_018481 [Parelaphostrongylus tenuis]|uniref:Exonuclease domain-containing protein n=1 Tax=Parelaphostrongylus tenuis TaxID=148309 RepID=A0AAD5QRF9_PARTN|nr:hypothetical protein KIN20_018481 [Parelaphostrongylus tenuis]
MALPMYQIIAEGPDIVINQPEEVLDNMEDWSRKTFAENGLLSKIRESKIDMKQAEDMDSSRFLLVLVAILDFLANETVKQACPLAGNSVHLDRRFISKYMPRLDKHLHYRIVDVSTIKEKFPRESAVVTSMYSRLQTLYLRESHDFMSQHHKRDGGN